jgi:hypothetical protein
VRVGDGIVGDVAECDRDIERGSDAAMSVSLNIAEARQRTGKDQRNRYRMSLGSAAEGLPASDRWRRDASMERGIDRAPPEAELGVVGSERHTESPEDVPDDVGGFDLVEQVVDFREPGER